MFLIQDHHTWFSSTVVMEIFWIISRKTGSATISLWPTLSTRTVSADSTTMCRQGESPGRADIQRTVFAKKKKKMFLIVKLAETLLTQQSRNNKWPLHSHGPGRQWRAARERSLVFDTGRPFWRYNTRHPATAHIHVHTSVTVQIDSSLCCRTRNWWKHWWRDWGPANSDFRWLA